MPIKPPIKRLLFKIVFKSKSEIKKSPSPELITLGDLNTRGGRKKRSRKSKKKKRRRKK